MRGLNRETKTAGMLPFAQFLLFGFVEGISTESFFVQTAAVCTSAWRPNCGKPPNA